MRSYPCLVRPGRLLTLATAVLALAQSVPPPTLAQWERIGNGLGHSTLTAFGFSPSGRVFGASTHAIFLLDSAAPSRLVCDLQGALAIASLSQRTLVAAGPLGVVRSVDDGDTWSKVSTQAMRRMESATDGTLYGLDTDRLLRSDDLGSTWRVMPQSVDIFSTIAVRTNGEVLLAQRGRFIRSTDRGESFSHVTEAPFTRCIVPTADNGVLVYDDVTMRSGDLASWDTVSRDLACDMLAGPDGAVHALVLMGDSAAVGLHRSDDHGRTWRRISPRTPRFYAGGLNGTVWVDGYRAQVSSDTGRSWSPVLFEPAMFRGPVHSILQRAGDPLFVLTSAGELVGERPEGAYGLYRSTDEGVTWELSLDSIPFGMVSSPAPGLLVHSASPEAPRRPVLLSIDAGRTWDTMGLVEFVSSYGSRQLPGGGDWEVVLSTSHGVAVSRSPFVEWRLEQTSPPFEWFALLSDGTMLGQPPPRIDFARRSLDGGRSWTPLLDSTTFLSFAAAPDGAVVAVVHSRRQSDRDRDSTILIVRSDDSGEPWTVISRSRFPVEVHGLGPEAGYVLITSESDGQVNRRSTDGGRTWHSLISERPLGKPVVTRPGEMLANAGLVGQVWLMRSTDSSATWHRVRKHSEEAYLEAFEASPGEWTFAGTFDGLFRMRGVSSSPLNPDAPPPPAIVAGVLPNPARDHVTVVVDLALVASIDIELHDMLGNLVRRASHACAPGRTSVRLDTDGLAPGAYALTVSGTERRDGSVIIIER